MSNELKQRFLSLDVDEISVVDTPAVEVEFLVAKRLMEERSMPGEDDTVTKTNETQETEVVSVDSESTAADDAAVTKALEHVASMVENVAKAAGVNVVKTTDTTEKSTEENTETETKDADASTTEEDTEKAAKGGMRAMYEKQLKAAGIKGDALKACMQKFDKQFGNMEPPVKKNQEPEAQPDPEQVAEEQTTKALEALEQAIQKAKRFTPAREKALKAALETLQKLYNEMKQVPVGSSPPTSTPTSPTFGASSVVALTKSVEALTEAVTKGQTELANRVEAIEKSRTPSKSIEDEGATDTQNTEKSFWSGVL